jgi:hypothetical protein
VQNTMKKTLKNLPDNGSDDFATIMDISPLRKETPVDFPAFFALENHQTSKFSFSGRADI